MLKRGMETLSQLMLNNGLIAMSEPSFPNSSFDVEYEVYGMKWGVATDNPTDAQIATAANWDEDYDDHRQFKIVKGIFNATA